MDMLIFGGLVHVGVSDMRDAFGFRVGPNTLPSNVDEKQTHASLIGQLVRFEKFALKWSYVQKERKS